MDNLTKQQRSWNMSRIKGSNTGPERIVRSILHRMGYRFCLYRKDLPGKPDITLPKHRTVIFVHGCFWHRHKGCKDATMPKTRCDFWREKLEGNAARDKIKQSALRALGWHVSVVWECETESMVKLNRKLDRLSKKLPCVHSSGLDRSRFVRTSKAKSLHNI